METVFVFVIVGAAAAYLVQKFYRSLGKKDEASCGCGCTSCPTEQNCADPTAKKIHHAR